MSAVAREKLRVVGSALALLVEFVEEGLDRAAHHLASLIEGGLYHSSHKLLVAARVGHIVARETHYGTAHLRRRIEYARLDGE